MATLIKDNKELMIGDDGVLFYRELSKEEQAEMIIRQDIDEELKLENLHKLGFSLEQVFDLAFKIGCEDDNR
jgi:hypothetical protein